jgi:type II secretory pathway pseudopilin PulG
MRSGRRSRGYTIIEVMIFLAVSGFMFVIAATFISGKQSKSEFRQGMNSVNAEVQRVINDVGNGFYPSTASFSCTASTAGGPPNPSILSPNGQGSNEGCVFLGKVVQFGVQNTNRAGYNVYVIAGRQYVGAAGAAATLASSFAQSQPIVIANPDLTTKKSIEWGLKVTKMIDLSNGNNLSGVGFFQSFPGYDSTSTLVSGSQTVTLIPISGTLDQSEGAMIGNIQTPASGVSDANVQTNPNILICFDGQAGEYGSLIIGGTTGQKLTTNIQISSDSHVSGC